VDHSVFGLAMKINRHGRAKILTQQEILQLFAQGFDSERDKTVT
jgi:integrase/recombinase XerD